MPSPSVRPRIFARSRPGQTISPPHPGNRIRTFQLRLDFLNYLPFSSLNFELAWHLFISKAGFFQFFERDHSSRESQANIRSKFESRSKLSAWFINERSSRCPVRRPVPEEPSGSCCWMFAGDVSGGDEIRDF